MEALPFWRRTLLLDLSEDAFGLVIDALGAGGELAVALDLLLPTHVASLAESGGRQRVSRLSAIAARRGDTGASG
jgi:hypothetical protein